MHRIEAAGIKMEPSFHSLKSKYWVNEQRYRAVDAVPSVL